MPAQQNSRPLRAAPRFQDRLGMLTRRVYFHMVRSAGRLLAPLGVTVEQYVVMAFLVEEEELTQQELVRRCASDPRTMGKMLDVLAAKGWTLRVDHASDRRAWQIVLSAAGRRAVRRMDEALVPLRERPAKVLGATDTKALKVILARLAEELEPAKWLSNGERLSPAGKSQKPSAKSRSTRQ